MEKTDPLVALLNQMLAKMGRNLLRFQQIESGLKLLLPIVHPESALIGREAYAVFRDGLKGTTLGGLRSRMLEAFTFDDPDRFAVYAASVVDSRNEFIHHFLQLTEVNLHTQEGLEAGISYLDKQYDHSELLYLFVIEANKGVLDEIAPGWIDKFLTALNATNTHRQTP